MVPYFYRWSWGGETEAKNTEARGDWPGIQRWAELTAHTLLVPLQQTMSCGPQMVLQGNGGEIRDGTLDISLKVWCVDLVCGKKKNWKVWDEPPSSWIQGLQVPFSERKGEGKRGPLCRYPPLAPLQVLIEKVRIQNVGQRLGERGVDDNCVLCSLSLGDFFLNSGGQVRSCLGATTEALGIWPLLCWEGSDSPKGQGGSLSPVSPPQGLESCVTLNTALLLRACASPPARNGLKWRNRERLFALWQWRRQVQHLCPGRALPWEWG